MEVRSPFFFSFFFISWLKEGFFGRRAPSKQIFFFVINEVSTSQNDVVTSFFVNQDDLINWSVLRNASAPWQNSFLIKFQIKQRVHLNEPNANNYIENNVCTHLPDLPFLFRVKTTLKPIEYALIHIESHSQTLINIQMFRCNWFYKTELDWQWFPLHNRTACILIHWNRKWKFRCQFNLEPVSTRTQWIRVLRNGSFATVSRRSFSVRPSVHFHFALKARKGAFFLSLFSPHFNFTTTLLAQIQSSTDWP